MTTDDGRAQARLVALAGGPAGSGGAREAGEDLRVAAEQRSRRALRAAGVRYAAAHAGDDAARPLRPSASGDIVPRRRWLTTPRVALVALAVLGLLTAVVVVRTLAPTPVLVSAAGASPGGAPGPASPGDAVGTAAGGAESVGGAESGGAAGGGVAGGGVARAAEGAAGVVVHVVGEVVSPGVVRLAAGDRVVDAVDAAGGATPDADLGSLNLARVLVDGEQVVVPAAGAAAGAPPTAPVASDPRVDLNAADVAELDSLPGIGPVLAERVVAWREEHGGFSTVDELGEVSGIGPAVLEGLRDLVRV